MGYWKTLLELTQMADNPPETYQSPFGTAILYAHLGEKKRALTRSNRPINNALWR